MKLIWTRSSLPLSVLIRTGLRTPVSHFGIVFDNGIVFHSNLLGTHIEWYGTFVKHCEVVFEIEYAMTLEQEEAVYRSILNTYDDHGYDFGAFAYFAWRAILYRTLGLPFPPRNAWESGDKFLCTELARTLPDYIIPLEVKSQDFGIMSPFRLFALLKGIEYGGP